MNKKCRKFGGTVYYVYENTETVDMPPLLMIHGHGGSHQGLEDLAKQLNATVVVPDLPGFGESQELPAEHTIEQYVLHLKSLADELGCLEYSVLGHSLGSAIALSLAAADARVNKLSLINPVPEFNASVQRLIRAVNGIGSKVPPKAADAFVNARLYNLATFLLHSRRRTERLQIAKYMKAQGSTAYSFKTWAESGESVFFYDHTASAKVVNVPTLVVHGERDSLTSHTAISAFVTILKAQLVVIKKSGHFLPFEQSREVAQTVQEFLYED